MIELRLIHNTTGLQKPLVLDEAQLVIEGERLLLGANLTAVHREARWHIGGDGFGVIRITTPLRLHFENSDGRRSDASGPYRNIALVDGMLLQDDELLAAMDLARSVWRRPGEELDWSLVVLSKPVI